MRGRRARAHASQESLVKDSSSEASPRDSSRSAIADRRRQRRAQRSPQAQQYDNQAYDGDERPLPPPIERPDDDEEEENIQNADRLVSHVAKQHRRIVNEVQQQSKKPKKKSRTTDEVDDEQTDLNEQIREQQEILSRRVGDTDDEQASHTDTLPPLTATTRGKSLEQLLEMAKRSRTKQTTDDG
jgi:hypothetical protein